MKVQDVLKDEGVQAPPQQGAPQQGAPQQAQGAPGSMLAGQPMPQEEEREQLGTEDFGESEASPEEQQAYDQVILSAGKVLYEDETYPQVEKMLQSAPSPAEGISAVSVMVLNGLDEKSGGKLPDEVLLPALGGIVELVAELADAKQIFPVDEAVMNRAGQIAFSEIMSDFDITDEEVKMFMDSKDPAQVEQMGRQQVAYQEGADANGIQQAPRGA